MTGFSPEQVRATLLRDGGICGMAGSHPECQYRATTANHRYNRQAGGSKYRNGMGNSAASCDPCNDGIESDEDLAEEARRRGFKVDENRDPAHTPMWSMFYSQWVQPGDEDMTFTGIRDSALDARTLGSI